MIKKSFIFFFIFLVLHIVVRDVLLPDVTLGQAPWQMNQFRAQEYLYSTEDIENVLTGSSISFHFDTSMAQDSIYNAAFTGESSHKGVSMIGARGKLFGLYPQVVLVELNTLDNYAKSTFEETLYNPFLFYPRKYIPSLRDGRQPLVFFAVLLEKYVTPHVIPHRYTLLEDILSPDRKEDVMDKEQKEVPVAHERLKALDISPKDKKNIEQRLNSELSALIENGCIPIFFETSVGENQRLSPKYQSLRDIVKNNYPPSDFLFVENPIDSAFQTYDGYHLTGQDNKRYARYLFSKVDSLIASRKRIGDE